MVAGVARPGWAVRSRLSCTHTDSPGAKRSFLTNASGVDHQLGPERRFPSRSVAMTH
jgi:hypothetical protein